MRRLRAAVGAGRRQPGSRAAVIALAAALLPVWLPAQPVWAESIASAHVTAELLAEYDTIRPGDSFTVGVSLHPAPDWHTYWRNSGDSGLPTKIEWKLPPGIEAGPLQWPHPVRLGEAPLVTFGYERDVLLLTHMKASADLSPGAGVEIAAAVRWLACREDACVPGKADLSRRMPVDASPPKRNAKTAAEFDAARAALPQPVPGWTATAREDGDIIRIEVAAPAADRPSASGMRVFPVTPGILSASADTAVRATGDGFVIESARDKRAAPLPDPFPLVLVSGESALALDARSGGDKAAGVVAPGAAVDAKQPAADEGAASPAEAARPADASRPSVEASSPEVAQPIDAAPAVAAVADHVTLWAALGLAFLGGIILNLMPCVFPVLSLKVLGFVHVAHHEAASVRRHGYAFTAGVLVSFWILAAVLLALRAAGGVFGWGFQLQEPLFVAALAGLLLAMALNLFGVFEFGTSVTTAAGRFDSASGYSGSFLSGVLATLLATPCSAPFMGTAVGYALVQPASTSVAVFTSLGLGMASPYLLLACVPALIRRLPRPGVWMEHFRQAMAFPLLATVAWLVWVFGQQTGEDGVLRLLLALLVGSMGAWIGGRFTGEHATARGFSRLLVGACVVTAVAITATSEPSRPAYSAPVEVAADGTAFQWMPWDPDAIGKHRSEGRVVFVDFTADWCLSCKVNERVALSGDEFIGAMTSANAVAMKADWTSADPRITEALAAFGRSGVPLYVVYPSDPSREPTILPQILTPALVREALTRAAA